MNMTSRSSFSAVVRALFCSFILAVFTAATTQSSIAAIFTLVDENSSADFDTATAANNFNWNVDGGDVLAQQAFWYRIGNTPESSVHTLPIGGQAATDTNIDGNLDNLFVRYNGAGFKIETNYRLDGGLPGSGKSDLAEQISISNLTGSPLDFHFFQYADFDLSGADSAVFTNVNTVDQFGPILRLNETVVTPVPSHREIAFFPVTLNKLNDGLPTTLNDAPPIGVVAGPGDMTWAYQWDVVIPGGGSFLISKDKNINLVPEPATGLLLIIGMGVPFGLRRRHRIA